MPQQWRERCADKMVPAAAALKKIGPGDRVFIGSACGEPQALVRAMVESCEKVADAELMQVLTLGVAPYTDPKYAPRFRTNAFFIGNSVRGAVNEARADYTPIFLSQVPGLFKSRRVAIDVALIMISPPDEHGYCSLGVSVDITKSAVESAKMVIAQVNSHMPRILGDSFLHVDQINYLVEHDESLFEWPMDEPDETIQQIARHIARLIPDGATL
ncbi:MAG: 4-hydroxybutyrate coenzyme A transferase, partial [Planctomycetota bacterium]